MKNKVINIILFLIFFIKFIKAQLNKKSCDIVLINKDPNTFLNYKAVCYKDNVTCGELNYCTEENFLKRSCANSYYYSAYEILKNGILVGVKDINSDNFFVKYGEAMNNLIKNGNITEETMKKYQETSKKVGPLINEALKCSSKTDDELKIYVKNCKLNIKQNSVYNKDLSILKNNGFTCDESTTEYESCTKRCMDGSNFAIPDVPYTTPKETLCCLRCNNSHQCATGY